MYKEGKRSERKIKQAGGYKRAMDKYCRSKEAGQERQREGGN